MTCDCLCCSISLLLGGVGVGAEGEACVVVPQHTGDRFHVYTILEGQGRECVSEFVEAENEAMLIEMENRT